MLSKRIIACLDVRNGWVVKGVNFEGLRNAGDPAELAGRYNDDGIDEVVILDVTATLEARRALTETIRAVSRRLFIPLTVGGGIRSEADAAAVIEAGADKVSVNTRGAHRSGTDHAAGARYGSQAVIVAVDARRAGGAWTVFARSGQAPTERDAVEWAREAETRGAGEILLTSIDRDGTRSGLRLRADRRGRRRGLDPGHRLGRRRDLRAFPRSVHRRAGGCRARRLGLPLLANMRSPSSKPISLEKRVIVPARVARVRSNADPIDRPPGRPDRSARPGRTARRRD